MHRELTEYRESTNTRYEAASGTSEEPGEAGEHTDRLRAARTVLHRETKVYNRQLDQKPQGSIPTTARVTGM